MATARDRHQAARCLRAEKSMSLNVENSKRKKTHCENTLGLLAAAGKGLDDAGRTDTDGKAFDRIRVIPKNRNNKG